MKLPNDIQIGIKVDKSHATKEYKSYMPAYRYDSPVVNRDSLGMASLHDSHQSSLYPTVKSTIPSDSSHTAPLEFTPYKKNNW